MHRFVARKSTWLMNTKFLKATIHKIRMRQKPHKNSMQKKDGINEEPTLSGKQSATVVQIPRLGYWHKYKCITGQAGYDHECRHQQYRKQIQGCTRNLYELKSRW